MSAGQQDMALIVTADSNGPRFLEKGSTVSESVRNLAGPGRLLPCFPSVFQSCSHVSKDSRITSSMDDHQANHLVKTAMCALSTRVRRHQQEQQQEILDESSRRRLQYHASSLVQVIVE